MKLAFTGNSCVGKSTIVRKVASTLDLPVFDVDAWTATQYKYNAGFRAFLRKEFDTDDKDRIREKIKSSSFPDLIISKLKKALKPSFEKATKDFYDNNLSGIIDMAQLFEAVDVEEMFEHIIVVNVTADLDTRLGMAKNRGVRIDEISRFDANQYDPLMKATLSDFTIENRFTVIGHVRGVLDLIYRIEQVRECSYIYSAAKGKDWEGSRDHDAFRHIVFKVIDRYTKNNMVYHNFDHVMFMLRKLREGGMPSYADQYIRLFWSILFHDIVYDPFKKDNEEESAKVALEMMKQYPSFTYLTRRSVAANILHTKAGYTTSGFLDMSYCADRLQDLDYLIFAESADVVIDYDNKIFKEYAAVYPSLGERYNLRIAFLQNMLTAPILKTCYYNKFEEKARENVQMLIDKHKETLAKIDGPVIGEYV